MAVGSLRIVTGCIALDVKARLPDAPAKVRAKEIKCEHSELPKIARRLQRSVGNGVCAPRTGRLTASTFSVAEPAEHDRSARPPIVLRAARTVACANNTSIVSRVTESFRNAHASAAKLCIAPIANGRSEQPTELIRAPWPNAEDGSTTRSVPSRTSTLSGRTPAYQKSVSASYRPCATGKPTTIGETSTGSCTLRRSRAVSNVAKLVASTRASSRIAALQRSWMRPNAGFCSGRSPHRERSELPHRPSAASNVGPTHRGSCVETARATIDGIVGVGCAALIGSAVRRSVTGLVRYRGNRDGGGPAGGFPLRHRRHCASAKPTMR